MNYIFYYFIYFLCSIGVFYSVYRIIKKTVLVEEKDKYDEL